MAWLQSSFTSHQLLGDSSSNQKKSLKNSAANKNSDPDKSDTPLLCESVQSPDNDTAPSGWLKVPAAPSIPLYEPKLSSHRMFLSEKVVCQAATFCNNSEKKQNLLANSSKSSFLPHGFFDKSSKGRMHTTQNSSGASNYGKKPAENMKLLSDKDNKKHPLFQDNNDEDDDNDEEDSDDEWCVPRLGGYQKVRPCAE